MKKDMAKHKVYRDRDGYERGGPDMSQSREVKGEERDKLLKRVKRGPVKRFLEKITA